MRRIKIPKPVMVDCGFTQQRPPLLAPPISPSPAIAKATEAIERMSRVRNFWSNEIPLEYRCAPPPKPIIEHKITEADLAKRSEATAEELRKKIDQYKDINEGLLRTNNQLQQSINEKTARINQLGKEKVGPFNIVIDTIDTSYVRDEKLTEIENLRNEFALVNRKGAELSKQMTELRRINLKLDLKLKGRNVRFDIKGIFF